MLPHDVAALLLKVAQQLQHIAHQMRHDDQAPSYGSGSFRYALALAVDQVAYWVSRGVPDHDAIFRAALGSPVDQPTLQRAWVEHKKLRSAKDLHARRLMVKFLTDQKWKDADIARLLGVHVKHIPRMRRAMKPKIASQGE